MQVFITITCNRSICFSIFNFIGDQKIKEIVNAVIPRENVIQNEPNISENVMKINDQLNGEHDNFMNISHIFRDVYL